MAYMTSVQFCVCQISLHPTLQPTNPAHPIPLPYIQYSTAHPNLTVTEQKLKPFHYQKMPFVPTTAQSACGGFLFPIHLYSSQICLPSFTLKKHIYISSYEIYMYIQYMWTAKHTILSILSFRLPSFIFLICLLFS